jgi:phosphatidylserine/phosphatidylglycerophosphate/cardiolipin synthase-like enzyme
VLFSLGVSVLFAACATAELKEPPPAITPDQNPGADVDAGDEAGSQRDGASSPDASGKDGGTTGADAGLAYTSAVSIIVEPSDKGQALISAIQGAKTSVHMTMYLLSNDAIVSALKSQKSAGHDVKVVLNQTSQQGDGSNATVYSDLKAAGVNVVYAPSAYTLTHEKCVIIDGATAWIMTMNATQTSPTDNREYLAVDTDPADVAAAEAVFQADYTNTAVNSSGKLLLAPVNAKDRLVALIGTATKTLDLEGEELSDADVVAALTAKADAGVKVRVVLADAGTTAQQQAITTLKAHSIPVVAVTTPYVHAKTIVVDGARAYVGSENFTTGSLKYNRELGGVFDTSAEVAKVSATIAADFGKGSSL